METVPLGAAAVLLAGRPDLRAALGGCGRLVGARVEVDLRAVAAAAGPDLAALLEAYAGRCSALWAAPRPGQAHLLTRRPLESHVQVTGKKDRTDLVAAYEALTRLPGLAELLHELTAAEPDPAVLAAMADALVPGEAARVEVGEGALELTLPLEGAYAYPQVLGGLPWPGEVRRVFTLLARQAGWRDRRVRRLARVEVAVDELWADPGDLAVAAAALPAAG